MTDFDALGFARLSELEASMADTIHKINGELSELARRDPDEAMREVWLRDAQRIANTIELARGRCRALRQEKLRETGY